jgi:hypothetical protein
MVAIAIDITQHVRKSMLSDAAIRSTNQQTNNYLTSYRSEVCVNTLGDLIFKMIGDQRQIEFMVKIFC